MRLLDNAALKMCTGPLGGRDLEVSAELYRNYSEHMDVPPESEMPLDTRYEIYLSKVVYLRNLLGQCFASFNRQFEGTNQPFSAEDFVNIQRSFFVTRDLIRECMLQSMSQSLDRHARRFKALPPQQDTISYEDVRDAGEGA